MIRAHKIRLYPNNKQVTYFSKACGVARFAYNWALSEWIRQYEAGEKVNEGILRKQLNAIKKEQFPWMLEVSKCAPQLAIKNNLNNAFKNFFRGLKQQANIGYPKFHKKGVNDSFSLSNDQFKIDKQFIRIPKLGGVRLSEMLRFDGKIIGATISRKANIWYVSIQVELPEEILPTSESQAVGVDLGIKCLATLSNGTSIVGSKSSRKYEKKLRRLNQSLSRKIGSKKGEEKSRNFMKTKLSLSKIYLKISNLRSDETHKLTTMLTEQFNVIGIEDLNVKGMMSNHKLARSVADMSFFEFRRQLEYKSAGRGSKIVVADRWYPSSKLCNVCGEKVEELPLNVRDWECKHCGTHHDRDVNAAINLRNYAVQHV